MISRKIYLIGRIQQYRCWEDGSLGMMDIKLCLKDALKTGQVVFRFEMSKGHLEKNQNDNPYDWDDVCKNIEAGLLRDGFKRGFDYEIMLVPNIVNISYGRGVGYIFEEEVFDDSITSISATKIRKLRDEGKLK